MRPRTSASNGHCRRTSARRLVERNDLNAIVSTSPSSSSPSSVSKPVGGFASSSERAQSKAAENVFRMPMNVDVDSQPWGDDVIVDVNGRSEGCDRYEDDDEDDNLANDLSREDLLYFESKKNR